MIYILSGEIGEGKTTALLNWSQNRTDVFGVLSPRVEANERQFLDLYNGVYFEMEATKGSEDIIEIGRYKFLNSAFDRANSILLKALRTTAEGYIIIDELGKLELKQRGLYFSSVSIIEKTQDSVDLHSVLVVRTSLLEQIIEAYAIKNYTLISKGELSAILE